MARPAPAASRAIQILDLLVTHPTERFTLSELVRRTGMSLGSAHATLAVLEGSGHISRNAGTRAYSLGPALVVAGVVALEHHPAIDAARQSIASLAAELGVEVVVSARTVDEIIFVARAGEHSAFGPGLREGERVPLIPPFGAVFFAWSQEYEIEQWLLRSPDASGMAIERLQLSLELARSRGFAVTASSDTQRLLGERAYSLSDSPSNSELRGDVAELLATLATEEYPVVHLDATSRFDVSTIAAPIFGSEGEVIAAISATGFPPGLDAETVIAKGTKIRDAAAIATRSSRGRPPAS
ncbi:MAG: helix-turn-helix domain-containing protein [Acidimicrobiales bacterium]